MMNKSALFDKIASIKIDGKYYPIGVNGLTAGGIKVNVNLENKTQNFYSWVLNLENNSDENSPRITEFMGMDLDLSVTNEAKFNTLRGDDASNLLSLTTAQVSIEHLLAQDHQTQLLFLILIS